MTQRETAAEDLSAMTASDKREAASSALLALASELDAVAQSMQTLVQNPGPDPQHFYAEAVRLASLATDMSTARRDILTELAAREPDRVSFPRLSALTSISVNTLRNRLGLNPGTEQRRATDKPDF